jgi:hypothetical protein
VNGYGRSDNGQNWEQKGHPELLEATVSLASLLGSIDGIALNGSRPYLPAGIDKKQ